MSVKYFLVKSKRPHGLLGVLMGYLGLKCVVSNSVHFLTMFKDTLDARSFWRSFVRKNLPAVFDNGHFDSVSKKSEP